jgi:hypothetical protein
MSVRCWLGRHRRGPFVRRSFYFDAADWYRCTRCGREYLRTRTD